MADLESFSDVFDEDEESISARVFGDADPTIDKRPGEIFHDITMPVVMEMAKLWQAVNEVAAVTFIPWTDGIYLDYKGTFEIGLTRQAATSSDGEVVFVGDIGTEIPVGVVVATVVYNELDPVYEFQTVTNMTIGMEIDPRDSTKAPNVVADPGVSTGPVSSNVRYAYTWVGRGPVDEDDNQLGETNLSPQSVSLDNTAGTGIDINNILVGPSGTVARNVYRSVDDGDFELVGIIENNTETSFKDTYVTSPISDSNGDPILAPSDNTTDRVSVPVESVMVGDVTNVGAGTVVILKTTLSGVNNVYNPGPMTGGQNAEDDDDYRERLVRAVQLWQGQGNKDDYRRWAALHSEVDDAVILTPQDKYNNNTETVPPANVRVVLLGPDNTSVSDTAVEEVQEMMDPEIGTNREGTGSGFAPVGAIVTVVAAEEVEFTVRFDVVFENGYTLDGANETSPTLLELTQAIEGYFRSLPAGGDVIWAEVLAVLVTVPGVANIKSLKFDVNGVEETDDVIIDPISVPVLSSVGLVANDVTPSP